MTGPRNAIEPNGARQVIVDVAAIGVVSDARALLVTYGLGSCIALCVHDRVRRVAGMLHYMLPCASVAPDKAHDRPAMFGDTGIELLFARMAERGCARSDLVIKAAGGGQMYDDRGLFRIGERNYALLKMVLEQHKLSLAADDVGGNKSRTVRLYAADGKVVVSSAGEDRVL